MKGSELIELWKHAKDVFDKGVRTWDARACEEMGRCVRNAYDVTWDGCSVCTFMEKHLDVIYSADCYDKSWTLRPCILTTHDRKNNNGLSTKIMDIDPDFDYEVDEVKSPAEKLESGELKCRRFCVCFFMPGEIRDKCYFDDFDKADAWAQAMASEKAKGILSRERGNPYVRENIVDNKQRAKELHVLRFYPYYVYDCRYTNAVVVDAEY